MMSGAVTPELVLAMRISAHQYRRLQTGAAIASSDEHYQEVAEFLSDLGLPNPNPFACFAAFLGQPVSTNPWFGYGTVTGYLRLNVLMKVEVAAWDDIQDAAVNGRRGRPLAVTGDESNRYEVVRRLAMQAVSIDVRTPSAGVALSSWSTLRRLTRPAT